MCAGLNAQSMKMVVDDKGDVVGRLVKINETTYTVSVQDDYDVPKEGNKVVTFQADKGQGIVYPKNNGNINVRKAPSVKSPVVAKIPFLKTCPTPTTVWARRTAGTKSKSTTRQATYVPIS